MDPLVNGLAYFAEGVQRHCITYLRDLVQNMDGTTMKDLQLLGNFLPEFGSIPWAMKPLICYTFEYFQMSAGVGIRLSAFVCAVSWGSFAFNAGSMQYYAIVLVSAAASLSSAASDALVDGLIAEQSANEQLAVSQRVASEYGRMAGNVLTGILAYGGNLPFFWVFLLATGAWFSLFSVFSCGIKAESNVVVENKGGQGIKVFLQKHVILIAAVTFIVCMAPICDLFLYRQKQWKFNASDQTLVQTVAAVGWIGGVTFFKQISARYNWLYAFRLCLIFWCLHPPISMFVLHVAHILAPGNERTPLIILAIIENSARLFATAMTFMPCNVGMQLCCRSGTGFALLQLVGALASAVGRNLDYRLQMIQGVTIEDVHHWPQVVFVSGLVRVCCAVAVAVLIKPLWDSLEKSLDNSKKDDTSAEMVSPDIQMADQTTKKEDKIPNQSSSFFTSNLLRAEDGKTSFGKRTPPRQQSNHDD